MIALGITGRSGCGKSTVTAVFSAHGVPLADADQIIVVDEGRIVQRGTHDQLMGEQGLYRDFVNLRREAAGWRLAG